MPKPGYERAAARTVAGVGGNPLSMSEQNAARAPRISIGPGETMVFGLIIAFVGGAILASDGGAVGAIVITIGATMAQVGIITTAIEWALKRTSTLK